MKYLLETSIMFTNIVQIEWGCRQLWKLIHLASNIKYFYVTCISIGEQKIKLE